jgi:hypothetical protein
MIQLIADEGKVLSNGEMLTHSITIEEEELDRWQEIADKDN